jgi:O-antigen/teichoic acid export membrane protein
MVGKRGGSAIATGGPLLAFAKLFFLLAAYSTTLALTRLIDPAELGRYNVVGRLIAIPNMVLIQTLLFAVSRPMAAEFDDGTPRYDSLRRRGFLLAAGLGGSVCLIFVLGAPFFSTQLGDAALTDPIRAVAPISLFYAFYAVNVGTINATRRFSWQAACDVFMAATKATLIISFAALGFSLAVTLGGFTLASAGALTLSVILVRVLRPRDLAKQLADAPPMATFAAVLVGFTAITNVLQSLDVFVLKAYAVSAHEQDVVGFYSTAQLVGLVPLALMNAVALTMFPLIATLSASDDSGKIRRYVSETLKVTVLLLGLMATVGSAAATEVQALLFPQAYGQAAEDLRHLVWGYSGYSVAITSAWILNSTGRSRMAMGLVGVVLLTVAIAARLWVPESFDLGAARAVALAGGVGFVCSLGALWYAFRASLPVSWALKVLVAIAVVQAGGMAWAPTGNILILAKLTALTLAFLGVVAATRAVTLREIKELRRAG